MALTRRNDLRGYTAPGRPTDYLRSYRIMTGDPELGGWRDMPYPYSSGENTYISPSPAKDFRFQQKPGCTFLDVHTEDGWSEIGRYNSPEPQLMAEDILRDMLGPGQYPRKKQLPLRLARKLEVTLAARAKQVDFTI